MDNKIKRTGLNSPWFANVARSLGASADDIITDLAPTSREFVSTNAVFLGNSLSRLRGASGTVKGNARDFVKNNPFVGYGRDAVKNALADIKSGNINNVDREMEAAVGDGFMDLDLGFDDEPSSKKSSPKVVDRSAPTDMKPTITAIEKGNRLTNNTLQQSIAVAKQNTKQMVESGKANTNMIVKATNQFASDSISALNNMDNNIEKMVQFQSDTMSKYVGASIKYYDESLKSMNDTLKQMKEFLNPAVNNPGDQKESSYDRALTVNGALDMGGYASVIKSNINAAIDSNPILQTIKMIVSDEGTLKSMVANPLASVSKAIVTKVIPAFLQETMKSFDKSLSSFFPAMLMKITRMSENSNPFLRALGDVFGVKSTTRKSVDVTQWNKGSIPFDSETKKSIVEVIPGYLRKMLAALDGKQEISFDYKSGTWKKVSDIKEEFKRQREYELLNPFQDFKEEIATLTSAVRVSQQEREKFEKNIDKFFLRLADNGYGANVKDRESLNKVYDFDGNQSMQKMFQNALLSMSRADQMKLMGSSIYDARKNENRFIEDAQNNLLSSNAATVFNQLSNDDNFKKGSNGKLVAKKGSVFNPVDKFGYNQLDYLQQIKKILIDGVRVFTAPVKNTGGSNVSTIMPNEDPILKRIRKQQEEEEKIAAIERKRRQEEEKKSSVRVNQKDRARMQAKGQIVSDGGYGDLDGMSDDALRQLMKNYKNNLEPVKEEKEKGGGFGTFLLKLISGKGDKSRGELAREKAKTIIEKPAQLVKSMLEKVDALMYDMVFGEPGKNKQKSIVARISDGIKDTFSSVGTFIKDKVFNPIKEAIVGEKGIINQIKNHEMFQNGNKNMQKIINSLFGEKVDGRRSGGMLGVFGDQILDSGSYMKYMISGKKYTDRQGKTHDDNPDAFVPTLAGVFKSGASSVKKYLFGDKDAKDDVNKRGVATMALDTIKTGLNNWSNALFGKEVIKGDKKINPKQIWTSMKTKMPKALAKGVVGAAAGTLLASGTGLLGAVFLPGATAALLGGAIGMSTESNSFMRTVFGDKNERGERMGGIISKQTQDFFSKNKNVIIGGGALGLMKGALGFGLLPAIFGGPVAGAALGVAGAMIYRSNKVQDMLFGKMDNKTGEKIGGLFNKVRDMKTKGGQKFKDLLPNSVVGVLGGAAGATALGAIGSQFGLLGAMLTPVGPIGGAILGLAGGIAMSNKKFNRMLFGEFDEKTGKKEGGALTKLSNFFNLQIASPFKIEMKQIGLNMKKWFIGSIANPFKDALAPIKAAINNMVTSTSNMFKAGWGAVQGTISKVFEDSVGKPFGEFMRNSVGEPLLNFVKKTLKGAIYGPSKLIGGIISAPFRAMGFAGRRIEKRHKRKGVKAMRRNTWKMLGDTTGRAVREERLTLKGLYNKQGEKIDEGLFGQLKRAYFDKEAKEAAKVSAQGAYYAPEEDRRKAERDRTQKDMFDAAQAKIDEQRDRLAKARKLGRKADYDNFLNIKRPDGTENKIDVSRFYNLSSMGRGQRQFLKENEYAAKEYSSNFKDLLGISVQELLGDSKADVGNLTKGQRKTLQRAMKSGYTGNALRRHMGIKIETAEEAEEKKNAVIKTTASKAMATMPDVIKDTMKLSDDKRGNQLKEHAVAIVKGITGVFRNKSEQEIMQDMDAKRIVGRRKKNTNSTSNNRESSDDGESAQSSSDGGLDEEDSKISKIISPVKGMDKKYSHIVNLLRSVWTKTKPLPVVVVSGKVKPTGDGGSGPGGNGPTGGGPGGGGGGVDSPGAGSNATLTGTFNRTKSATKSSIRGIQNLNEFRKLYKSGSGGIVNRTKGAFTGLKDNGNAAISAPRNTRSLSGATRMTPSVLKNGSIRSANIVGGFRRNDPAVYGGNTPEFASRRNVSHILGEKAEQQEIIERSIFRSTTVDNLTQIEYNTRTTWKLLEGLQASLGKMKDGFADLLKPLNRIADGVTRLPEVMSDLNQNVLEKMNEILDALQNDDGGSGDDFGGGGGVGGGEGGNNKTTPIIGKGGGNGGRRQNTYTDNDRYNIIVNVAGLGSGANGGNSTTTSKNKGKGDKTPPPVPPTTPQTVVVSNTGSGGMMMMPPMTSMSRGQTVSKQPLGPSVNIPVGPSVGTPIPNTASRPTYTGTGTYRTGTKGYNNTKPVPTPIGGKNVVPIPTRGRGKYAPGGGGFFQPGSGALGLASGLMAVTPAGRGGGMLKDIAILTGVNYGINQVMNSGQDAVTYVDENGQVVTEGAVEQGKSVMDQTGAQISQTSGDLAKFYKWDAESREKANMPEQTPFKESELYKSLNGTWEAVAKTFKIPESVDYINEASNKIIDTLNGVISQTGNNLMNAWESIKNNDFGGALGDLTQGGAAKALLAGGAAALGYAGYRAYKNHRTRIRLKHQDLAHRDMNDLNKSGKGTLTQIKEAERKRTIGEFTKDTLTTRHFTKSGRAQLRKEKEYRNERREMARKDHDTYMRDWRTGDVSALEAKYENVNKYDRNGNLRKELMGDPNRTPEGSYYKGVAYDGKRVGDITDARFESGSRLDDMINRAKHPIQYADYVHEQNQRGKHVYNRDGGEPFRKKRTLMGKIAIGGAVTAGTLALGPAALPVAAAGGAGLFGYRKWKDRKKNKNAPTPTTVTETNQNQTPQGQNTTQTQQQVQPVQENDNVKQGKESYNHNRGMIVKGSSTTKYNGGTFVYDKNNPKTGGRVVTNGNVAHVDFGQNNSSKSYTSSNVNDSKVVPINRDNMMGPSTTGSINRYRAPIGPNMGSLVQFPGSSSTGGVNNSQTSTTMTRAERKAQEKAQSEYKPIKGSLFRHPMSVEEQIAEDKRLEEKARIKQEKKRKNAQINAEANAISAKRDKEWAARKEQHKAIVAEEKAQKQAEKDKANRAKSRKGSKASHVRDENYADYKKAWAIADAENESNRQKKKREKRVEKIGKMRAMITAGRVRDENYADYKNAWGKATAADRAKKELDRQNKKDYATRSAQVRDENYADYKKAWAEATAPEREAKEAKIRAKQEYSARSAQVRDENYADYKKEWGKVNAELDRQKRVKIFGKQRETIRYSGRTRSGRLRDELAMPKEERRILEQELAEKGRIHNATLKANEEKEQNRLRQYNTDRIQREIEVEKKGENNRGTLGSLRQQRADNKHYILNGSHIDRSKPIPKGYIVNGAYSPRSSSYFDDQKGQIEAARVADPKKSKKSLLGRALKGGDSNRQGIVAGDAQLRKDVAAAGKEMRQNIKSAAKSLSGSLSSAGKTVSNSIKGGAKSASASLTKAGASTTKAFASGSKSIMSAGMSVSKAGGTVAKSLSTAANPLVKAASSLGTTMSKSKSAFDSFFSRLRKARVGGAGAAGGMNDLDMMGGKGGKKGGLFGKLGGGLAKGGLGLAKGLGKNALKAGLGVIPGLGLAAGASMGWADGKNRVDDIFNIKEGEKATKEQTKAAGIGGAIVGSIPFADMIDQAFGGKITKFFADLAFDFDKKFEEIKGWFGKKMDTIKGWIGEKVGPIWDKVKEPFVAIYDTVNEKYKKAKEFVVETTLKTYNAIAKPVKAIWNKSKEIWDKVSSTVKKVFSTTLKVITAPAKAVLSVSKKVWDKVSSSVKSAFTKTYNAVSKPVKAVLSTAKNIWDKVSSTVSSGFGKVKEKVTTVVSKVYDIAKDKFDGAKKAVSDKFTALKDKIAKVVGDIWDKTKDKFDGAKKAVVDKFTTFKDGIGDKVDKIVTAISDPIGAVKDMVTDKFNAVKRKIESFFSAKEEEYAGGKTNAGRSSVTNNFYYGGGTTNISKVRKNTNHVYGAGSTDVDKDGDVYYSQKDSRWAGQSLAGGGGLSFGDAGCGPTAASMLISSVNNSSSSYGSGNAVYGAGITWGGGKTLARSYGMGKKPKAQPKPTDALRFAQSGGYVDPNLGTRSDFFNMYSAANGIATRNQENPTGSDIRNELAAGNKMVLRGVGGRNYTNSGHYIVATGLTPDGKVKVKDPLSKSRSGEFDADSLAQNATTAIIAQGKQPKDHGAGIIKQRAQFFGAGKGMEPHQYNLYDENDTPDDPSVDEMGDYVGDAGLPASPIDVSPLLLSMNVAEYGDPLSPDYLSEDSEDGMGYGAGKSSKKKKVPASKFIQEAKKYMGWKYVWGGSTPKTSFDCSGLVQYTLKSIGISMTRTSRQQYSSTKRIKAKHARVGDLVFFSNKSRWRGNPTTDITHVGIVDKDGYMINAAGGSYYGKVVRHKIQGTHPAAYIVAYGRVPGIQPGELSKGLKSVWGDKHAPKNDPYEDQKVSKSKKGKSSGKTDSSKIGTAYKTIKEKVFTVKDPFEQFRLGLDLALRSKLMNKKVSYNQFKDLLYTTVEKQIKVQGTKISSGGKSDKKSKDSKLNGKGFKNTKAYSGRFGKSPLTLAGSVKGKEDHVKNIVGEEIAKSEGGGYFYGAKYGINYKKQRISPDMGIFHWRESTAVSTVNRIIKEAKKKLPYQAKFTNLGTWKRFWNDNDLSQWKKFLNADKTATVVGQNKSASAKIDENMRQIESRVGKTRMPTKPHQYVALADIINTGNHLSKMRSVRNVSDPTMASAIQSAWLGRKIYYDRAMRVMNATRNIKWKKDSDYGAGNIKGAVWGAGRSRVNYRPGVQSNLRRAMYSGSRGSVYGAGFANAPKARPSGFSFGLGKGKPSSSKSGSRPLPYTVIRNAPNNMMVTPPGMITYGRHDNHKGSIRVNSVRPVATNIKTWGSGFAQGLSSFSRPQIINRYVAQPPVIMGMGQEPQDPSLMMQMVELLTQIVDNTFAISENTKYISIPTEDGGRTEVPVVVQGGQPQPSGGQGSSNGLAQAMAISRGRMN